jgi:ubiquinone/menaquinone biosynthesis C-methylase UbiE
MNERTSALEASYDRVAERYAAEFSSELERKPFDCAILDSFVASVLNKGPVSEIGCGPAPIARYLQDRGLTMSGLDLSEEMIKCARLGNPDISFQKGDMLALPMPDASLGAIVCFYAIIHQRRGDVTRALREMNRVLQPGGLLLLSFHAGEGELHRDQWYDQQVSIDVCLFESKEMSGYLEESGFEVARIAERDPYEFEYPTRRVYVFAEKPLLPNIR